MIYDAAVVGAGPAGASAALALAGRGGRVVVLEKDTLPRYKTCGGGLLSRAVAMLPPAARAAIERDCCAAELNFPDSGLSFGIRRPAALVGMAMRARLDMAIVTAARQAGTEIRDGCEVLDLEPRDEHVTIETSRGQLRARFVVAADGATSPVARLIGWRESRRLAPALEAEVTVDGRTLERLSVTARFDFDVIPCGYGWVFPKAAHLSVGLATMRHGGVNLNRRLHQYLAALGIPAGAPEHRRGWLIPYTPRRDGFARHRVLLTGDAAGLADPVTGEGITAAIRSGRLAAAAIAGELPSADRVEARYEADVRREFIGELRVARMLSALLYEHPRLRALLFRRHGGRLARAMLDVAAGERTYVGSISNPRNYVRLLFAPRAGATSPA